MMQTIDGILAEAEQHGAKALWRWTDRALPSPAPRAVPYVWKYAALRELLLRASDLVTTEEAKRRAFRYANPGLQGACTDTLYAGIQCILQGERAPAHRHSAFALRFVLEGSGAYTSVDGERLRMEPGDLILTPSWRYHDHQKDSEGPIIWLDGLDLPMFQVLRIGFQDAFAPARNSLSNAPADSNLRYEWAEMRDRLRCESGPYAAQSYLDRITGGPISRTIGAKGERIEAAATSPRRKETTSHVYACVAGHGRTVVGTTVLEWVPGDVFAVPAWQTYFHENVGRESAYLFSYDDRPMLDALGLYRLGTPEPQ